MRFCCNDKANLNGILMMRYIFNVARTSQYNNARNTDNRLTTDKRKAKAHGS